MNKFEQKIRSLEAAKDVNDYLEYKVSDEADQMKYYIDRAEESKDENGNVDEDNYYLKESKKYVEKINIYKELIDYIEKKYLK